MDNYLDDNGLAQYNNLQVQLQIPKTAEFFKDAGVVVKMTDGDGPVRPMKRKVVLGFMHDVILKCPTFQEKHKNMILAILDPIVSGRY